MALDTTALTETSAFTANVYPPLSNTTVVAADVAAGEQALANRTLFLNDTKFDKAGGTITGQTIIEDSFTLSGASANIVWRTQSITNSSTAETLTVENDVWYVQSPTNSGTIVYTLKSTGPAPPANTVLQLLIFGAGIGTAIEVQREGGAVIVEHSGGPSATWAAFQFIFLGGSWRLMSVSAQDLATSVTYGAP
jgi:hypothetical protein